MVEGRRNNPTLSGPETAAQGWTSVETSAAAATAAWLIFILVLALIPYFFDWQGDPLRPVIIIVSVMMPVALIWIAARTVRTARMAEDEIRRLSFALDSVRQSVLAERQTRAIASLSAPQTALVPVPQGGAAGHLSQPASGSAPARRQPERQDGVDDQPTLMLEPEVEDDGPALMPSDVVRALHFPDDERDKAGFAALRLALRDHRTRQLIQASQDVLTLMSQDGIYMDDLPPGDSHPELWRRFAKGERGDAITALGNSDSGHYHAVVLARLREDPVFRDAVHHFLRLFDRRLTSFETVASDEDIVRLAETRTARAFTLLGHVAGIFD